MKNIYEGYSIFIVEHPDGDFFYRIRKYHPITRIDSLPTTFDTPAAALSAARAWVDERLAQGQAVQG